MTYKIIRFYRDSYQQKVIKRGLTLEQAQAHCKREDTHADIDETGSRAWFDGYDKE